MPYIKIDQNYIPLTNDRISSVVVMVSRRIGSDREDTFLDGLFSVTEVSGSLTK